MGGLIVPNNAGNGGGGGGILELFSSNGGELFIEHESTEFLSKEAGDETFEFFVKGDIILVSAN